MAVYFFSMVQIAEAQGKPRLMDMMTKQGTKIWATWGKKAGKRCCWYPKIEVYVKMPGAESDDILVVQHLQGRRKWGKPEKCPAEKTWQLDGVPLVHFKCRGVEGMMIDKTGKFGARLSYMQTAAERTHRDFAMLTYKITKYQASPIKERETGFVVDYDFHMGEAWLNAVLELTRTSGGVEHNPADPKRTRIMTWFKWKREGGRPYKDWMTLRCYYKDKKVAQSSNDQVMFSQNYYFYESRGGKSKRGQLTWGKFGWHLQELWVEGPTKPLKHIAFGPHHDMSKNPGEYTCKVTAEGEVVREFKFNVGADGKLVKPKCHAGLTLPSTLTMIKLTKSKGDAKYDKRALEKSPFYGRKWAKGCPL